ncbi:MAG: hypothetical protein PHC64_01300 [Candidatus Gastranaerophilales bacterium]|nr:hypothetical protein [Candidatus Gastranaerophilales bacterium]
MLSFADRVTRFGYLSGSLCQQVQHDNLGGSALSQVNTLCNAHKFTNKQV